MSAFSFVRRQVLRLLVLMLSVCAFSSAQSVTITEYPVSLGAWDITTGPDGALWFTENSGNKIGRITTAGAITEYPIPTPSSQPTGITSGPDGAVWFTEDSGNKIGRIATSGTMTEYTIPTV